MTSWSLAQKRIWKVVTILAFVTVFLAAFNSFFSPAPAAPDPVALKVQGPDTIGNLLPVQVFPAGAGTSSATQVTASSTGAAAALTETLPGVAGKTTYLTGFQITGGGATAASNITVTVTGLISGTNSYNITVPAGATVGITPLNVTFPNPISASAVNTAIVVNVPSFGAGNTAAAAAAQGFQQ